MPLILNLLVKAEGVLAVTKNVLLEVKDLEIGFKTEFGVVTPLDDVSFELYKGETLGIVGESGCGKTITAFSLIRLLPKNSILGKKSVITFEGQDISKFSKEKLQKVRGKRISMVFQEPMTSLNPLYTIGWQLSEVYKLHENLTDNEAMKKSISILEKVGIPGPEKRVNEYPHQLSGGMRQRIMIAMALACNPALLIADEPTTALDVTIQAQVLELMNKLKSQFNTSIIMITHDLGVIAEMCDRVIVMYAGQIVEIADIFEIFDNPSHPYTMGLINSIPKIEVSKAEQKKLNVIDGYVPQPANFPKGCRFKPRCSHAMEICDKKPPVLKIKDGHEVKCWLFDKEKGGATK